MSTNYPFKRAFCYEVQESAIQNHATFIAGVRKCGKTVCMTQLAEELPNAEYYDVKTLSESQADELLDNILTSIRRNEKRIYLIDEITSFLSPEIALSEIAMALSELDNTNTNFVFAGSQSAALRSWAGLAFAGNAKTITADFLSYPEWLAYKGISEVSEKTYNRYLLGTMEFYKNFVSLENYLRGCLDETVLSNFKSRNVIMNNSCDLLDTSVLTNILYAALVHESNRADIQHFFDTSVAFREIRANFRDILKHTNKSEIESKVDSIFSERLHAYTSMDLDVLRQSLIFLHRCGLITLTYVSDERQDFSQIVNVYKDLTRNEPVLSSKNVLFEKVNICVRHPFFFAEIVKDVLQNVMPPEITGSLLGSMVECHVRSLLPEENHYEYHAENGNEVDYVNFARRMALECSISNKSGKQVNFTDLPDDFTFTLLTKNQHFTDKNGLVRIPYYVFIFTESGGEHIFRQHNMTPHYSIQKMVDR